MKVNDLVLFHRSIGKILRIKEVNLKPLGMNNYVMCKVEFADKRIEWINGTHLKKVSE